MKVWREHENSLIGIQFNIHILSKWQNQQHYLVFLIPKVCTFVCALITAGVGNLSRNNKDSWKSPGLSASGMSPWSCDLPWLGRMSGMFSGFAASYLLTQTPPIRQRGPASFSSLTLGCCHFILPSLPGIFLLPNPPLLPNHLLYFASQSFFPSPLPGCLHLSLCSPILLFQEPCLSSHRLFTRPFTGCQWQTIILGQNNTHTANQTSKSRLHLASCRIWIFNPSFHACLLPAEVKDRLLFLCL